jgi:hypothetical protein
MNQTPLTDWMTWTQWVEMILQRQHSGQRWTCEDNEPTFQRLTPNLAHWLEFAKNQSACPHRSTMNVTLREHNEEKLEHWEMCVRCKNTRLLTPQKLRMWPLDARDSN